MPPPKSLQQRGSIRSSPYQLQIKTRRSRYKSRYGRKSEGSTGRLYQYIHQTTSAPGSIPVPVRGLPLRSMVRLVQFGVRRCENRLKANIAAYTKNTNGAEQRRTVCGIGPSMRPVRASQEAYNRQGPMTTRPKQPQQQRIIRSGAR